MLLGIAENNFAQKVSAQNNSIEERDIEEIRLIKNAIEKFDEALTTKNLKELNDLVSDNLDMVHSNGLKETKQTLIKNIKDGYLRYNKITHIEEPKITPDNGGRREYKHSVARIIDVEGVLDGKEFKVALTVSESWILENSHWVLVKKRK
jgi:hypothetical protein